MIKEQGATVDTRWLTVQLTDHRTFQHTSQPCLAPHPHSPGNNRKHTSPHYEDADSTAAAIVVEVSLERES